MCKSFTKKKKRWRSRGAENGPDLHGLRLHPSQNMALFSSGNRMDVEWVEALQGWYKILMEIC